MAEKKEFAWTSETAIGEVAVNDKKKLAVAYNTLEIGEGEEEREYISITTHQHYKKKGASDLAWHITKNATFPLDTFSELVEMVTNYMDEME